MWLKQTSFKKLNVFFACLFCLVLLRQGYHYVALATRELTL